MKAPRQPPRLDALLAGLAGQEGRLTLLLGTPVDDSDYLHWDELRRRPTPAGMTHEEWWLVLKLRRTPGLRPMGLQDKQGRPFRYAVPEAVLEAIHQIDMATGGRVGLPEPLTEPRSREPYLAGSLIEEAITSSQLEGAVTTREVAKEMIRTGRRPRDTSERMILNNYLTMQHIRGLKDRDLSPGLLFELHALATEGTLADPAAAGRLRRADERVVVGDEEGEVFHDPPPAEELEGRLEAMCAFANGGSPGHFLHPLVRAMILHFWLAYDHPFVDGNGRTARALFYWSLLRRGYWLFEFLSISSVLRQAPARYGRSFLFIETDDNDLTYFLVAQARVILRAVQDLHAHVERRTGELRDLESRVRALERFNPRQVNLILHALKHPGARHTFATHQRSQGVAYQTARTDLLGLEAAGLLVRTGKRWNATVFVAPDDLGVRLLRLEAGG